MPNQLIREKNGSSTQMVIKPFDIKKQNKNQKKKIHIEMHHRFKRAKTIKFLEENIKETYSLLRSR